MGPLRAKKAFIRMQDGPCLVSLGSLRFINVILFEGCYCTPRPIYFNDVFIDVSVSVSLLVSRSFHRLLRPKDASKKQRAHSIASSVHGDESYEEVDDGFDDTVQDKTFQPGKIFLSIVNIKTPHDMGICHKQNV